MTDKDFKQWRDDTINNYKGDPQSLNISEILYRFTEKYPIITSRANQLSKFKRTLMERTSLSNYTNGHEYNVAMRKLRRPSVLLGNLNNIKLDIDDSIELHEEQQNGILNKASFDIIIKKEVIDEILGLIDSEDINEYIVALTLATGRRSTEINKTGNFYHSIFMKEKDWVCFTGKLKNDDYNEPQYIPVLCPIDSILIKHQELRELYSANEMTNEQCDLILGSKLRNSVNKVFSRYGLKVTPHTLRSIYIAYLYQYKNPLGYSKTWMISEYLLHGDTKTTASYNNIRLLD